MTYSATVAEIRTLRRQWRRSDDDYQAHPTVMCGGYVEDDPCPNVAHPRDWVCGNCRRANARRRRGEAS